VILPHDVTQERDNISRCHFRVWCCPIPPIQSAILSDGVISQRETYVEPLVIAGDVNIRLERSMDPHAVEFRDLLACYGLDQHVHDVTHDRGGMLDVVCTRGDLPSPNVIVSEVGFSDHRLLR